MESPLLFPVRLENNVIVVLDETQIPFKEHYIKVTVLDEALAVLKEMKTRSLGQVLLFFYSCLLFGHKRKIDEVAADFSRQRPTFDFFLLAAIVKSQIQQGRDLKKGIESFLDAFDRLRRQRAKDFARLLPDEPRILTICNINGELIYLYQELQKIGKKACFYVCETRPYLQGTRLTFWELSKNNIPCKLLCDNQAALLMRKGKINSLVSGADRATQAGDIVNKAGTYGLARLAGYFGIPFYALTQHPRDIDVDAIEIEERPPQESFMYLSGDYSGIDAFYPAFDITRADCIRRCLELKVEHEAGRHS
jgi:methylthioribose-1-phosphate isomerase